MQLSLRNLIWLSSLWVAMATHAATRVAVLEFETPKNSPHATQLAAACEATLGETLSKTAGIELVERTQIAKIVTEHGLSRSGMVENPLQLGEWGGAEFLLFGRVIENPAGRRAECLLLEVASGNVVLNASANDADTLTAAVMKQLPGALRVREPDLTKPTAAVLNVKNTSRLQRLSYLEPVVISLLEETIDGAGKYRLLRRQYPAVAGKETELAWGGWVRPSDAVVAARADVALAVEIQEKYEAGLTFAETPVELTTQLTRRNGETEQLRVTGKAGEIQTLLASLRQQIVRVLASGAPAKEPGESRVLEAVRLFREAVGEKTWEQLGLIGQGSSAADVSTATLDSYWHVRVGHMDPSVVNHTEEYRRQVERLERALYLDPGLHLARFFLAICLNQISRRDDDEMLRRVAQEWEQYLASNPRGQMRDYAYRRLMECYASLAHNAQFRADSPQLPPSERESWRGQIAPAMARLSELAFAYLKEPPRKRSNFYYLSVVRFLQRTQKPAAALDWLRVVDGVYGADHDQYNIPCPLYDAAKYLAELGRTDEAMACYERAIAEHHHSREARDSNSRGPLVLAAIYRAMGKEAEARATEQAAYAVYKAEFDHREEKEKQSLLRAVPALTNALPFAVAAPLPADLFAESLKLPPQAQLRCIVRHEGFYYAYQTGLQTSGYSLPEDWLRCSFASNLTWRCEAITCGKASFETILKDRGPRITFILPDGEFVWFGSHEGLGRYQPRTKSWRWLTNRDGLPTNYVLCGSRLGDRLWFGGGAGYDSAVVFSLDPNTLDVRSYVTDQKLNAETVLSLGLAGEELIGSTFSTVWLIDRQTGHWRRMENDRLPRPSTAAVFLGNRCWIGTVGGLARAEVRDGLLRFQTQTTDFAFGPPDGQFPNHVTALATDSEYLWIGSGSYLTAYNPATETWYGPLALPEWIPALQAVGDEIWVMGKSPTRFRRAEFLEVAEKAGLRHATPKTSAKEMP